MVRKEAEVRHRDPVFSGAEVRVGPASSPPACVQLLFEHLNIQAFLVGLFAQTLFARPGLLLQLPLDQNFSNFLGTCNIKIQQDLKCL